MAFYDERRFLGMTADRWALVLTCLGAVLSAAGFVLAFTMAPLVNGATLSDGQVVQIGGVYVSNVQLFSQKIFYFHMPVAITSFLALLLTAIYGIRFLLTKDRRFDTRAKVATEVALVFILCTMISGEMWERFEWGVWWTWEPRLTTYFILMLLVIGYFVLRAAVDDDERRCTYASVYGIITFIDAPICFMITRIIPSSIHPTIFRTDSGLPPDMLVPLLLALVGMLMIGYGMYRLRLRACFLQERIDVLKDTIGED